MTVLRPTPCASSQVMVVALASTTPMPSSTSESFRLLMAGPSPVNAWPPASSKPSVGCTVRTIGRWYASANAQSRSSWPGTAMIAPVP